ncbi:ornithine carbamoyltransferase [Actinomadura napierensis]|uniref:Ornithine carbamoyltransferase n=1 Tax=Actinomadura napierensis TaxID=267854 RepID=A0ABN2ZUE5_9ACTN
MRRPARHLLSIDDVSDADLRALVDRGAALSRGEADPPRPLDGQVAGMHFRMTSTRTRAAFSVGALRLGAHVLALGPGDLQTGTGETSADTGRVLAGMLDLIVARTGGAVAELRGWAAQDRMSVVNAMSGTEHPTQALADLATLRLRFGDVEGLRILYVGEGNSTAAALSLALSRFRGVELELRTPPGYGLAPDVLAAAGGHAARRGARITELHTMHAPPDDVDVIYTTRWQTTGTTKKDPDWRTAFGPFQVTEKLWAHSPKAAFMHDLPAHRGEEVTPGVLDGPDSIAFEQAANKLYSAMAVLEWCRGDIA